MGKPYFDKVNKSWHIKVKVDGQWKKSPPLAKGVENEQAAIEAARAMDKPSVIQDTAIVPTATDDDLRTYSLKYQGRHPSKRPNGIRRRETVLRRFCDFAESKGWKTVGSITLREVNSWVDHRRAKDKAGDGTVVSDLAILQGMFKKAIAEGWMVINPAKDAAKDARDRADSVGDDDDDQDNQDNIENKYYTREQQVRTLAALTDAIPKYRELVVVMLATGMRVDAARSMRSSWVNEKHMIRIPRSRDKGGKGYTTHAFGAEAKAIIDRRCQEHPDGSIFPEIKSDGSSYHYLAEFYRRHEDLQDIIEIGAYNHAWRHTFAVRRVEDGMAIPVLQKFMGHGGIKMTMRYAKVSDHAMMEAIEAIEALA